MAEERIVEDDLGREVKLRKKQDGSMDVVDGLVDGQEEGMEGEEEITFAYPAMTEEDDEDLVGLSPEEAKALREQKIQAAKARREEYEKTVAEGEEQLQAGSFHAAELKFEQALQLDELATEASVGYWRAKTANFSNPDVLMDEYVEAGIESLEYDLGYEAVEIIKKEHRTELEKRYKELKTEEEPLFATVMQKQDSRREILKSRRTKSWCVFGAVALPFVLCVILAVVFALKIASTPDNTYVPVTIVFGALAFVLLFVLAVVTNKLFHALRMYRKNEKLSSTEEGARLAEIMDYIDLYEALLEVSPTEE